MGQGKLLLLRKNILLPGVLNVFTDTEMHSS